MVGNLRSKLIDFHMHFLCYFGTRFKPKVVALNKYILNKNIGVTAVVEVSPNVTLKELSFKSNTLRIKAQTSVMASMM